MQWRQERQSQGQRQTAESAAENRSTVTRSSSTTSPPCVGFFVRTNPMPIRQQQLLQILPNAGQSAGVFVSALNTAMNHYQIVGLKRVAAFIAQIGHESGQLKYVKEIWGPCAAASRNELSSTLSPSLLISDTTENKAVRGSRSTESRCFTYCMYSLNCPEPSSSSC